MSDADRPTRLLPAYGNYRDLRSFQKARGAVRPEVGQPPGGTYSLFREFVETREGPVVANIALCLIHQANYLLDRQIQRPEKDFLRDGGLRERMSKARREWRLKE